MRDGNARHSSGRSIIELADSVRPSDLLYESAVRQLIVAARTREACIQSYFTARRGDGTDFHTRQRLRVTFEHENAKLLERERWLWAALTGGTI